MNEGSFSQALHVVENSAPAGTLSYALGFRRDQLLVNEDRLSCGPAPQTASLDDWRAIRETFLRGIYLERPEFSFEEFVIDGLLMNAARFKQDGDVVVWIGLGLQDQLLLAWVAFLFDRLNADPSKLYVVQFEELRPGQRILTVGELSPENIREKHPAPRQLDPHEAAELRQVWKVYTSSDPADLASYVRGRSSMPHVQQAISHLVNRYPDIRSGLSECDERLLQYTNEKGPVAARIVGNTMGYNDSLDGLEDSYLFYRLVRMANMKTPLVSLTDTRSMRSCEVMLTEFGKRVLGGQASNFRENGLDDWIGGVHLSNDTRLAFRDNNGLVTN